MLKILQSLSFMFSVWIFRKYQQAAFELAEIEAAKKVLLLADQLRIVLRNLTSLLFIIGVMSCGAVMALTGIIMLLMLLLVPENYDVTPLALLVAFPMIISGFLCFLPLFFIFFYVIFSEEKWLAMVKENRLVGPFLGRVLFKAERQVGKEKGD